MKQACWSSLCRLKSYIDWSIAVIIYYGSKACILLLSSVMSKQTGFVILMKLLSLKHQKKRREIVSYLLYLVKVMFVLTINKVHCITSSLLE